MFLAGLGHCVHALTKSYVSELERGTRTPRVTTLRVLARRLNRPLSYFLDGVVTMESFSRA